jgi:PGF-CTERM protein
MGGLDITAASPWSVSNVSISPSTDWVSAMYADGSGWHIENTDADGDGDCNSEPSSVVIVFTTPEPEPEPVVDTTPVCDIYYHVGGAVLTAGSTWSVQLQGAVSFEVPSNGEFSLALPVGEYSVVLACNDAESDAIVVSVTDGTDTWGGTAQDGVIYAEGMFEITEENVNSAVDINLTWSSTDFGGTFNVHFTAVESIADAIEDSDTGGLPGFTSVVTITAMLGAAMILARRKD